MQNFQNYLQEYFQYILGFTQVLLDKDDQRSWIVVEVIANLQKLAMIFVSQAIGNTLLNNDLNDDNPYSLFEKISSAIIPSTYVIQFLDITSILTVQIFLIIGLYLPVAMNIVQLRLEKQEFQDLKFGTRTELGNQDFSQSINQLNRSYNQHSFIEHFLQKLLMGSGGNNWSNQERNIQARYLNWCPHIFVLPYSYWNMFLWVYIIKNWSQLSGYLPIMIIVNIFTSVGGTLIWCLALVAQSTYSIRDTNHLRIHQSIWFNLSQILKIAPIFIQALYMMTHDYFDLNNSPLFYANVILILIILVGDLIDIYISLPFVMTYKTNITLVLSTFCIVFAVCVLLQESEVQIITICIIVVPVLSRILIVIMNKFKEQILESTLKKDKLIPQDDHIAYKTGMLQEEEEAFVIEREISKQRKAQTTNVEDQDFKYFIHYLRMVDLLDIEERPVLRRQLKQEDTNPKQLIEKSKFMMKIILLIMAHTEQCTNTYCFCKGFRGEKRRIIEREKYHSNMKIYDDFVVQNLKIEVQLIKRYLRYYAKIIFEIEKNKINPSYQRTTQLLYYLSESDECYQNLSLIVEFQNKHGKNNHILQSAAMKTITSHCQYSILYRMQTKIKIHEIEATLSYKEFRVTEIRRDKLIQKIFANLKLKVNFLKLILVEKYSYHTFAGLVSEYADEIIELVQDLKLFHSFSNTRTSLLIAMFYYFEVLNDFDTYLKLRSALRAKNYLFFEYPRTFHDIGSSAEVCYLKANIARHAKKGKISRGEIIQFSNNAPSMFGYTQRQFSEQISTIHKLVSHNLARFHDQIMEIFILTNRPQIIRKRRPLLAMKNNQTFIFAEMFVDFCFNIKGDEFPVYCFLKNLKDSSRHDNIHGHIIVNDSHIIEGVSEAVIESIKGSYPLLFAGKPIDLFMPNFEKYLEMLNNKYYDFLDKDKMKVQEESCQNNCEPIMDEQLLNHFSFSQEEINLKVVFAKYYSLYEIECKIQLSVANIHGKVYKSYLIEIARYHLIEEHVPLASQGLITQSICDESVSAESIHDEIESHNSIRLDQYHFKHAETLSPRNSYHIKEPIESMKFSVKQVVKLNHITNRMKLSTRLQQNFYNLGIDEQMSEDEQELMISDEKSKEKSIDLHVTTTTSNQSNQGMANIIIKSTQYTKFSQKQKTPLLLHAIQLLDFGVLAAIITLALIQFQLTYTTVQSITDVINILEAFVTNDYTGTGQIALNLLYGPYSTLVPKTQIELILETNVNASFATYVAFSQNINVQKTLSDLNSTYLDSFSLTNQTTSAWMERSYVLLFIKQLAFYNTNFDSFRASVYWCVSIYQTHYITYQQLTSQFQKQEISKINYLLDNQKWIFILFLGVGVFDVLQYALAYHYFFKLANKLIRCCEQVTYKAIELEGQRCQYLVQEYPNYFELSLYNYPFSIKDKLNMTYVQFEHSRTTTNNRFTTRFSFHGKSDHEQKKQLSFRDSFSCFQSCFFLISSIGIVISVLYIFYIYQLNQSDFKLFADDLEIFNNCILYSEYFSQMMFAQEVKQTWPSLVHNFGLDNGLQAFYTRMVNETYTNTSDLSVMLLYQYSTSSYDLLYNLNTFNVCSLIQTSQCNQLLNGQLQQNLFGSMGYYSNIVRDNIKCGYNLSQITYLDSSDILSIYYINLAVQSMITTQKDTLKSTLEHSLDNRIIVFAIFITLIILLQICLSLYLKNFLFNRMHKLRQITYMLPPQSLYMEDSFSKTLNFIEKIYNNIFQ